MPRQRDYSGCSSSGIWVECIRGPGHVVLCKCAAGGKNLVLTSRNKPTKQHCSRSLNEKKDSVDFLIFFSYQGLNSGI